MPFIGLPNLVAEEQVVPELIQEQVSVERLVQEALSLLEDGERRRNMINGLIRVRQKLGSQSASRRTAQIALEMVRAHRARQKPESSRQAKPQG